MPERAPPALTRGDVLTRLTPRPAGAAAGFARAVPGTASYAALLSAVALALQWLPAGWRRAALLGASTNLHNLRGGSIMALLWSALVLGPPQLLHAALTLPLVAVGELGLGTRRMIYAFLVGHIGASAVVGALLWAHALPGVATSSVVHAIDVGPSYGAIAAVSAAAVAGVRRVRLAAWLTVLVALAAGAGLLVDLSFTSWGHLLSVVLGVAFGVVLRRRRPATVTPAEKPGQAGTEGRGPMAGRTVRHRRRRSPGRTAGGRSWVPPVAALLTYAIGMLNLVSAVTPASRPRLRELSEVLPGILSNAADAATTVAGLLLLLLAHGLRRRKRRAWRAVVALLAATVVFHVAKGLDVEEATVAGVLLGGLLLYRAEFFAKGDPRTRWRAVTVLAALFLASVAVGLALVHLRLDTEQGPHPFSAQLGHVLLGLAGVPGPLTFLSERDGDVISFTLAGMGALTVLTTAYLALRPERPTAALSPDDEDRLRELLGRYGREDSLGYFALRRDKSVVWSLNRKAAVAYRVVSGVALGSGDPVGDPAAWPDAIAQLLRLADEHAWVAAVIGCSDRGGRAYARAGLTVLEIGDEAVVEVATFTLEGRAMRGPRQAVSRIERAGYDCRVRRLDAVGSTERERIRAAAGSWRGAETERGFSMALGRIADPADDACVVVTAEQAGRLRALLHFVPWGDDGLSLDLMHRDRSAENGLNEYLIARTIQAAPSLGVQRLSLNFAVFRQALEGGERLGAGPVLRGWRRLLVFASRWFQIESLYRFNAKFRPVWEPRYLCYPAARDLPRVVVAALEAEAFLTWPRLPGASRARQ